LIVYIDDALDRTDVDALAHRVHRSLEAVVGKERQSGDARPLSANGRGQAQRALPVDRRTAADARSGENREGQIARGRRRAIEVESLHPDDLALVELRRLIARSLLEHDDTHPRACQLGGDNATAGTRSDDTRVRLQVYRRVDVRERERLAACRHV